MRFAALLAAKDLRETVRDRLSFIFIILMPLAFTAFFGVLFGGGSDVDKLPLAVWDADGAAAASQLVARLEDSEVVRVDFKEGGAFEQWMADERAAAGLIIPEGYSDAVASAQKADLTIVATKGVSGASRVASEVRSLASQQVTVELASRAAAETVWSTRSMPAGAQEGVVAETAARARPVVEQALGSPAVSTKVVEAGTAAGQTPSGFVLSSPGMMVNFILFSLMTAGVALIIERQNGTLQRLMTTRLRRSQLIGGKTAGMFLLTFLQQVLLIAVAQLFFGVDYLRDPVALLVMMVALSLVASTLGLLLASVLKSEQALVATTVLVSMAVAALSGAWFPLEITGETFQSVGHVLPTAWILDGLRGIVVRGFDVADVLPAFWVSLAWAAGFFVLAVWRFRLTE
ncbi:MAG: ABC transporter permease [Actinobacteria bacterium]|nr:ABC transporter permease [Actinomycetota bacterium]